MKKIAVGISTLALGVALAFAAPALAQWHHGAPGGGTPHGSWHASAGWHGGPRAGFVPMHHFAGHDLAHFSVSDRAAWRGGRWWHGPWHGRNGWWWFAGGAWYFYDTPVYPYPGYVSDYYADDDYYDYPDYAAPGATQYSWYYCQNPPGYYPYIQNCKSQWQAVPAGAAPPGYSNAQADQGPPPGYNDGPDDQDGPGPNGPPPPGPNSNGPNGH
jgi:hypothetical protein